MSSGFSAPVVAALSLALVLPHTAVVAAEDPLFDPTRPSGYVAERAATMPAERQEAVTDLRLGGIVNEPGGRTALINGRRVRAGDRLGEIEVRSVAPDHVVMARDGKSWRIPFGVQPVKRLTTGGNEQ